MAYPKSHRVALVPLEPGSPPIENLLQVAAALNTQAVHHLAPNWKVSASVSPFAELRHVPPEYDVVVIVPASERFEGPKGFHFHETGVAIAVVQYATDWSLFASHELMELLVDRHGDRTASGPSIQAGQGSVDYLVEVCDPCQHSTYTIDGVLMSDFVTPGYYGDPPNSDRTYSFMGRVPEPRALLSGGYITWATQAPNQQIWQAIAAPGTGVLPAVARRRTIKQLAPAQLTRAWIDPHPPTPPPRRSEPTSNRRGGQPLADAQRAFIDAGVAAERNGQWLGGLISSLVNELRQPLRPEAETEQLLDSLTTAQGQQDFLADPRAALGRLAPGLAVPDPDRPIVLPPPERYTEALNAFKTNRFGTDLYRGDLPGLVTWLCQLGGW